MDDQKELQLNWEIKRIDTNNNELEKLGPVSLFACGIGCEGRKVAD